MRRQSFVDWKAVELQYTPRKLCPGCQFIKYKHAYAKSERAKDSERGNCFLCVQEQAEQGQPFKCNTCLRWLPEESFSDNQRGFRSTPARVCV